MQGDKSHHDYMQKNKKDTFLPSSESRQAIYRYLYIYMISCDAILYCIVLYCIVSCYTIISKPTGELQTCLASLFGPYEQVRTCCSLRVALRSRVTTTAGGYLPRGHLTEVSYSWSINLGYPLLGRTRPFYKYTSPYLPPEASLEPASPKPGSLGFLPKGPSTQIQTAYPKPCLRFLI